eukprot:scaffold63_cov306-Pinguiococcus_pyrenoidosus.AAC.76
MHDDALTDIIAVEPHSHDLGGKATVAEGHDGDTLRCRDPKPSDAARLEPRKSGNPAGRTIWFQDTMDLLKDLEGLGQVVNGHAVHEEIDGRIRQIKLRVVIQVLNLPLRQLLVPSQLCSGSRSA